MYLLVISHYRTDDHHLNKANSKFSSCIVYTICKGKRCTYIYEKLYEIKATFQQTKPIKTL